MLTLSLEDSHECTVKARRVQHHELFHEDKIDRSFCAAALVTLSVSSGVRMDLLRDVFVRAAGPAVAYQNLIQVDSLVVSIAGG